MFAFDIKIGFLLPCKRGSWQIFSSCRASDSNINMLAVLLFHFYIGMIDCRLQFNREFQELITEYCWGATWGRGVLSKQQRSLNNLCMLAALNRPNEFKLHFRGALRNGCTLDEIKETLLQITVYCGVPAGVEAFRIGREVLTEEGIEVGSGE